MQEYKVGKEKKKCQQPRFFINGQDFIRLHFLLKGDLTKHLLPFASKFFQAMERLFGFDFGAGVSLPTFYKLQNLSQWRAVEIIHKLKQVGIVRIFSQKRQHVFPDEPLSYLTKLTLPQGSKNAVGIHGLGRSVLDLERTYWPAVGEAIERWALTNLDTLSVDFIDTSYKQLQYKKIDIFSLAGFTASLRKNGHDHYSLLYSDDSVFRWIRCQSLTY